MDETFINGLRVKGIIGIHDWEREVEQEILINIRCYSQRNESNYIDDINNYIDYENLTNLVKSCVKSTSRFTVEALAEDIAELCLNIQGVEKVIIRVEKPGAMEGTTSAGVQIER